MDTEPSIGALVGSLDQYAATYANFVQLQGPNIDFFQASNFQASQMISKSMSQFGLGAQTQ